MINKLLSAEQFTALAIKTIFLLSLVFLPAKTFALGAGEKAPDFHVVTAQGKEISYAKDIKGKKPVYLFFWTTW